MIDNFENADRGKDLWIYELETSHISKAEWGKSPSAGRLYKFISEQPETLEWEEGGRDITATPAIGVGQ
jgi:hypothetical protein